MERSRPVAAFARIWRIMPWQDGVTCVSRSGGIDLCIGSVCNQCNMAGETSG